MGMVVISNYSYFIQNISKIEKTSENSEKFANSVFIYVQTLFQHIFVSYESSKNIFKTIFHSKSIYTE